MRLYAAALTYALAHGFTASSPAASRRRMRVPSLAASPEPPAADDVPAATPSAGAQLLAGMAMKTANIAEDAAAAERVKGYAADEAKLLKAALANKVPEVTALIGTLSGAQAAPAREPTLLRTWRVAYASSAKACGALGSGKHLAPAGSNLRVEDIFLTFSGKLATAASVVPVEGFDPTARFKNQKLSKSGLNVTAIEVLRQVGPFPNLRYTLTGSLSTPSPTTLALSYASAVEWGYEDKGATMNGKGKTAWKSTVEVVYVGRTCCVLRAAENDDTGGYIVLEEETELEAELEKLRVKQTLADDKKKGDKPWFSLPDFTGGKGGVF